jgi:hypothetical protein
MRRSTSHFGAVKSDCVIPDDSRVLFPLDSPATLRSTLAQLIIPDLHSGTVRITPFHVRSPFVHARTHRATSRALHDFLVAVTSIPRSP